MDNNALDRRSAIKLGLATGTGAVLANRELLAADTANPLSRVRVGFVGIGIKGWQHYLNLLHIDGVEMVAVCDVLEEPCRRAQRQCKKLGMKEPVVYTEGEHDFQRMCQEQDLDLVYTATPWKWHVPVCLAAMENGSHAATEIPAALTVEDCWKLVDTSEASGKHLCMMENVNYRRDELTILKMVREGALGELLHADVGYLHDTRFLKIRDKGDGLWLGDHHAKRNGNLYPTHGLGPIAWNMDLGRGNRMEYLVSMSTKARGMNRYAQEHLPKGHPYRERDYINGDVNTSIIKTANGETIVIKHDTDLPRPYSRINLVQGTKGVVRGFPDFLVSLEDRDLRIAKDNASVSHGPNHAYQWRPGSQVYDQYVHPLWQHMVDVAEKKGTAMDGFVWKDQLRSGDMTEDYRLIEALLTGQQPDFDVYDAASWSVVSALSEQSVANRSQAVDFPDFTRGKWKTRPRLKIMGV
ncbi:MAG: Gfo/Idh/MocA family oxidoreductase [Rubripirellula sp.]